MCSMYWNLAASYTCPKCAAQVEEDLQTHWMGDVMSCVNRYELGEKVTELAGVPDMTIGQRGTDDFAGYCDECDTSIDLGARIEGEAVVAVWPVRWLSWDGSVPTMHDVAVPA